MAVTLDKDRAPAPDDSGFLRRLERTFGAIVVLGAQEDVLDDMTVGSDAAVAAFDGGVMTDHEEAGLGLGADDPHEL